jgi:Holliday junction resolvase RusA-like endonuclease
MGYRLEFDLPGLPKSPNELLGKHWRVRSRHANQWKTAVNMITAGRRPLKPLTFARLMMVRCSSVEPDDDNLRSSFKPIVDGLVNSGIISDDSSAVIGSPVVLWEKEAPRKGRIRVLVEELSP